ncbi:RNA methyltransferase [Desulfosporosinus sp. HMP52]|uniref:23S rRNA (adenine(2503)-C(2))-methyltransferase RlmN n=1 Tax=Desulfosporosinus sp. HMP52 TaxID=1487923 RepID=UPI00051FECD4|nr:23S rRNA (adenine(2503)-C(2))-methyltransferase RlmN [Desulfosporosinus sp. HMP52]KGK88269.1 RNA methyltransferase [Desulfosporosinus sp. HMP52]
MKKESIYGLPLEQLIEWLQDHGQKKSRALKVWDWLYRKRVTNFSEMTDLNPECLELLTDHFILQSLREHTSQESVDGTIKFLFRLPDDNLIETVLMRHKFGSSVCVTTQVGCNIGCSFCASGLLTKHRDLSGSEIVEQIMKVQEYMDNARQGEKVSHVVVMGIGEPFDNYINVMDALRIIIDHKGLAIPGRGITISTSGLADKIYEFADSDLKVNLAISLHAPNNELREQIMKINRVYPLEKIIQAVEYYLAKTKRRITLEYILLKDLNDQREHALQLVSLIKNIQQLINVNLIPYNPVDEHPQYQRSDHETMLAFYDVLKKHGINCSIRLEHGRDIEAACGQLRSKQVKANQG